MRIVEVTLRRLALMLCEPMRTSYGVVEKRDVILVELKSDTGARGVAECVAMSEPLYTEETTGTAWHMLINHLISRLCEIKVQDSIDLMKVRDAWSHIRGNKMAIAALEMAVWDAWCQESNQSLPDVLGASRSSIPIGIAIGVQDSHKMLIEKVANAVEDGYTRIKLKIRPGYSTLPLAAVRQAFPDVQLMADANSAFTKDDLAELMQLDSLNLLMIEQPLGYDDLVDHAWLQKQLSTPVCLDESIRSSADLQRAIDIGACRVVNLKPGRVGGFAESIEIHDLCVESGLGLWCGGMYETGVGRIHAVALSAMEGFRLPGDTGPSHRYFKRDIIKPGIDLWRPGQLRVEPLRGAAERVDWQYVSDCTVDMIRKSV